MGGGARVRGVGEGSHRRLERVADGEPSAGLLGTHKMQGARPSGFDAIRNQARGLPGGRPVSEGPDRVTTDLLDDVV